jgi:hypothetical protein
MRDLLDAPADAVAEERSRVAHEGWGAALLEQQREDGTWDGGAFVPVPFSTQQWADEGQPWSTTYHVLTQLWHCGVDPEDPLVTLALVDVAEKVRWEEGGQRFFEGETEPCINGRTAGLGAYFGFDTSALVEKILSERLADGGWNCDAPHESDVTSYDTTINVLEGLAEFKRLTGGSPQVDAAVHTGEEYLLARHLYLGLRSGKPADPDFLALVYPPRWRYDVLRALDYFRSTGQEPDPRLAPALAIIRERRSPDGTWPLDATYRGRVALDLGERVGEPSAWNTLRALRVMRWAEPHGL